MEVLPSGSPSSQIVTPGENLRAISIWVNVNSSFKSELINNADVIFVEQGMLYLYDTRSLECGAHETDCRWSLQSMHEARHTNTCTLIMDNHKNFKGGGGTERTCKTVHLFARHKRKTEICLEVLLILRVNNACNCRRLEQNFREICTEIANATSTHHFQIPGGGATA